MWAEISSSSERTKNTCESFHLKYNSLFYTHHPDTYFLEILKKIQIDIKIAIHTNDDKTRKNFKQQYFIHRRQHKTI